MGQKDTPLVDALLRIAANPNERGTLAALRSGLGKPPGTASRMFPIVAPFLTHDSGPRTQAAFIVAALFASHPEHDAEAGSLGASLWRATKRDENPNGRHGEQGVSARFAAALDTDPEDLPRHLQALVALCKSALVPIDWHQLYRDLVVLLGDEEERKTLVRTKWAREFWAGPATKQTSITTENQKE